jgi:hypothetical protein
MKTIIFCIFLLITIQLSAQSKLLINMDLNQTNHLKAYGVTFNQLELGATADWLLNYKGGSFLLDYSDDLALKFMIRGVAF